MSPTELLISRFILASFGCLLAGFAVWAMARLWCRRWPDFSWRRSIWLLGQLTIVVTFLVILLPHSERFRLVPLIDFPESTTIHHVAPIVPPTMSAGSTLIETTLTDSGRQSWLTLAAQVWLVLYLLGLGYMLRRLIKARNALHRLVAIGSRLAALEQHDGFFGTSTLQSPPHVIEVDVSISPMLFGLFQPRLLLPKHLRDFDVMQQRMMIAHELTHLRRRDLQWLGASITLQTLFWFNPCMWWLHSQLSWALELGCDRDVLSGRPQEQRKAYAAALVEQLRRHHAPIKTGLAFGGVSERTLTNRIHLIRTPAAARKHWTLWAVGVGFAGICTASIALQPALAERAEVFPGATLSAMKTSLAGTGDAAQSSTFSCTEMADAASGRSLVNEGRCNERVTPASTFNIAVSLMGYDSGVLRDEHTPRLPFRPGYAAWGPAWRSATDPTTWISNSVLWYAQQVTSHLGAARFQHYVNSFGYGNGDVSGDAGEHNGLTLAWLSSSLKISPVEQVAFLRKVVNRNLGLAPKAYDMTFRIMPPETLDNGWVIRGKTGTAAPVLPDGRDDERRQYGWYVGWATKGARTIVFARMVLERREQGYAGGRVKQAFLRELTARLETLAPGAAS